MLLFNVATLQGSIRIGFNGRITH